MRMTDKEKLARSIAVRIRNELRIATLNWAFVEALNNRGEAILEDLERTGGGGESLRFVGPAIVRDVISTLMRVTDAVNGDRQTICRISELLKGPACRPTDADLKCHIDHIEKLVTPTWNPCPGDSRLFDLRESLREIRNALISHARPFGHIDLKKDTLKVRDMLRVVSELEASACSLFLPPADNLEERWNKAFADASALVAVIERGLPHPAPARST